MGQYWNSVGWIPRIEQTQWWISVGLVKIYFIFFLLGLFLNYIRNFINEQSLIISWTFKMEKNNTLLCLENIRPIFYYSTQTDQSQASEFRDSCSSFHWFQTSTGILFLINLSCLLLDHDTNPLEFAKKYGVIFEYSFMKHISQTCSSFFCHIHPPPPPSKYKQFSNKLQWPWLVLSKLGYWNSLLHNIPET